MPPASADVLVIGGGPAGSTTAALLAEKGFEVVLVERESFPRFHVGESLLPDGNGVLERLGLLERARAMGWMVKPGASFLHCDAVGALGNGERGSSTQSDRDHAYSSIRFAEALGSARADALQVPRAEFDGLLLDRALELGVHVVQPARVKEVEFGASGVDVEVVGPGLETRLRVGFVVDASGQHGFLAKRMQLREVDDSLRNLATFAHYEGWIWPSAIEEGNIQVISLEDLAWMWIIPLAPDRVSVGLVEHHRHARRGAGERGARLEQILARHPLLREQSRQGRRVSEVYAMADFGYSTKNYFGERWLAVGDAGSFVDPVFSTGVYLALSSGEEAADALGRALRSSPRTLRRELARYEKIQRRRYRFFRRFVLRFYRPGMRDLLCQRREFWSMPRALAAVLAGQWRLGWSIRWRLEAFYLLAALQEKVPVVERLAVSEAPRVSLTPTSRPLRKRSAARRVPRRDESRRKKRALGG